jgi:nitrous oxide reductase accessory protein NosL
MKKILLLIVCIISLLGDSYTKEATTTPIFTQKGKAKLWCPICGMSIKKFYKTSYAIDNKQFCSLRCLTLHKKEHSIDINKVKTIDSKSERLILAKTAHYVVDSIVGGTMSQVSKLAFQNKSDALEFIKEYEGELTTFDQAYHMAKESLKSDIEMTNNKKQKKIYPMGKKIFNKRCRQNIDIDGFDNISSLKANLTCKDITNKQLQAVALYLWEVKRLKTNTTSYIKVDKNEKCPICGMFVYKYPRWAAQIFYNNKHYSFDGVKDLVKYYKKHTDGVKKVLVTDYYTQKAIDGMSAFYVVGSDVYGPMGEEFIPFEKESDAKTFKDDHKGKKVISFYEISISE